MGWTVGRLGGRAVRELGGLEGWRVERSDGRTVERKVTLEQEPSDDQTVGKLERK